MTLRRLHWVPGSAAGFVLFAFGASSAQGQFSEGPVQIHGFFTQGYALSDHNNYLTMNTSRGTAQMTDGGLNLSWKINGQLRVSAQAYDRYIGELGKGKVSLDWALVDYRFRDWLGFRVGKVKTPLGLFNDAQDQEFLYTWALLPQAVLIVWNSLATQRRAAPIPRVSDLASDSVWRVPKPTMRSI